MIIISKSKIIAEISYIGPTGQMTEAKVCFVCQQKCLDLKSHIKVIHPEYFYIYEIMEE